MQALVNDMSVRELRATIADGGVSSEGICEKDELRALALQILMSSLPPAATPPPTVPDHVTRHAKDPLAQAAGRRERVGGLECCCSRFKQNFFCDLLVLFFCKI